jgi:hypothetical protein
MADVPFPLPTDRDMLPSERRRFVETHRTCVLDEQWPVGYLTVSCDAVVDRDPDLTTDVAMAVAGRMSGQPLGEEARPFVEAMVREEGRVVLRCRPYATFATPPRHLHANDQAEPVTHWLSGSVAWDAADPDGV